MKLRWLLFLLLAVPVAAQTSAVSGTITDANGQAFANGTYVITFRPVPGNPGPYVTNPGGAAFTQSFSGNLDATGSFTGVTLQRNDFIAPALSTWTFQVCPQASSICFTTNISVTTATLSVTPLVVPPGIAVNPASLPQAYSDSEVIPTNLTSVYKNVTDNLLHYCIAVNASNTSCITWAKTALGGNQVTSIQFGGNTALTGAVVVQPGNAINFSQAGQQVTVNADNATAAQNGVVNLTGDIGGVFSSPSVVGLHFGTNSVPLGSSVPQNPAFFAWNGTSASLVNSPLHINFDTSPDYLGVKGSFNASQGPATGILTVTSSGGTGATYTYQAAEFMGGAQVTPSSAKTCTNNTTLNGSNTCSLSTPCNATNDTMGFWRTAVSGGSPNTVGDLILTASCASGTATLVDTGLAPITNGNLPLIINSSGQIAASVVRSPSFRLGSPVSPGGTIMNDFPNAVSAVSQAGFVFGDGSVVYGEVDDTGALRTNQDYFHIFAPGVVNSSDSLGFGTSSGGNVSVWPGCSACRTLNPYNPGGGIPSANDITLSQRASGGSLPQLDLAPIKVQLVEPPNPIIIQAKASAIASTGLCSGIGVDATACGGEGQYTLHWYVDDHQSCATQGPAQVSFTISFNDGINTKTATIFSTFPLGNPTSSPEVDSGGEAVFWYAGSGSLNYSTTYTACTTGTAEYDLYIVIKRIM